MKKVILFLFIVFSISACHKNNDSTPSMYNSSGVFVLNHGNFNDNNGTISYIVKDSNKIYNDIFKKENLRSFAGGVQDYTDINGKGYILIDNSAVGQDLIEVVNSSTFKSTASLPIGIVENPRSVIKISDSKAYISCTDIINSSYPYYNNGYIAILDLNLNTITKKFGQIKGIEKMILIGNDVFVGNAYGGDTLYVVDSQKDLITQKIAFKNPPQIIDVDINGKLWLAVGSDFVKINPQTKTIENTISSGKNYFEYFSISIDKKSIYYGYTDYNTIDAVYNFDINSNIVSTKPIINRGFSALSIDPKTGIFFAGFTPSYKQAGYIFRFAPDGSKIDSLKTGINPIGFSFK